MIAAAIPFKRLEEAKSRLSATLDSDQRRQLALSLLQRTVSAIRECELIEAIALVTPESWLADEMELAWLPDGSGLNPALSTAVSWAKEIQASSLMILPADLPLIAASALRAVLNRRTATRGVGLAETQDGGTGLLLLTPPGAIPPAFGPGSFARHAALAQNEGIRLEIVDDPAFGFDLDTVEDLEMATQGEEMNRLV